MSRQARYIISLFLIVITAAQTAGADSATPALVAAYSFDEGSGTTIADASGHGNTGTISNATWTTAGKYGKALIFNGINARVDINDSASLHLTTGMTLEAWVYPWQLRSAWRDVIYKGDDNYYLSATSYPNGMPAAGSTTDSSHANVYGMSELRLARWTHLAATYDGTTLRLYVNGVEVASRAQTGPIETSGNPLQLGGDKFYGQYFTGKIDEVRVYNVALTAEQIQADMNTPVSAPLTVELAEKTPPEVAGPPPTPTPTPCVPIDCGGYYACSCQVCCENSPQSCYRTERSSVLQAALDAGCTVAPGNDCNTCPMLAPPPTGQSPSCVWVSVWGEMVHEFYNSVQLPMESDRVAVPGCFASYWDQRCVAPDRTYLLGLGGNLYDESHWGDCGAAVMDLGTFLGDPEMTQGTEYTTEIDGFVGGAYWYMDANCHWTFPGADTKICGVAALCVTPLSLLWEENASLSDGMTVVPFSINARQPQAYSLWKASEKAPLLVYDPKHTGRVTSATQLFGTYTFGGRTTNASYSGSDALGNPWGNGYEALALLDTNQDAKLSGKELDPLALWFDKDRDGVSQPGEVEALSAVGVVTLYYGPDKTDPKSGDIRADLGYERLVNGKLVQGASTDWFAQTFSTRQEAAVALSAIFQQEKKTGDAAADELAARAAAAVQKRRNDPLKFHPHQAKNHREDLSGYWYWTVKEKGGENHPGVFAFEQIGGHELTGYSVIEAPLAKNDQNLRSAVSALPATGTVSRDKDGKLQVTMKIIDRKSGGTAQSTATLSEDGLVLSGKTTQLLVLEGDGRRNSATVDYEWVARKFAAPTKAANK